MIKNSKKSVEKLFAIPPIAFRGLVFKRGEEVKAVGVAQFCGGADRITGSRINEEKMGGVLGLEGGEIGGDQGAIAVKL
jgi:hypothetical protein